ncbi:hypothetical protein [Amycolatopsis albispora]|uniref:Guanylate cyclase domain-containing protein n=1 Tax=Amycolatopsis albispora TaxID=1804986 RepID=A0A344LD09_9PSEU|nr:hypothetical protein [Amycolatopsis albispora]AXB45933.1 hypothetical protein A4R43_28485 [Amycolatopsis albispora]
MFGYDIVGSSSNEDDELDEMRRNAARYVEEAFAHSGVQTAHRANYSSTGDGAFASFPETDLPALIDSAHYLDGQLHIHNRKFLPPIRLRLSVHTGPLEVTDSHIFQRRTIELARGLDARSFKKITEQIERYRPPTIALIVSDQAYRVAVQGRYTERLHPHNFGELVVRNKEFTERCWVHVPGLDAERVKELTQDVELKTTSEPKQPRTHRNNKNRGNLVNGDNSGTLINNVNEGRYHA